MTQEVTKNNYISHILKIALPVSLQALFASSLSVIDQIMVGRLGETEIASVSLAGRYPTVFFFTVGAISVGAGILISQYKANIDNDKISKSFTLTMKWGLILTAIFFSISFFFSPFLMTLFSPETNVQEIGSNYLKIITIGFLPGFLSVMLATFLRSTGKPVYPSIASITAMLVNTLLNFILIFGYLGFPALGVTGAAIATTISRVVEFTIILLLFIKYQQKSIYKMNWWITSEKEFQKKVFLIIAPIFVAELAWSLGEAVYGMIFGHIGTDEMAAMSLIGPMMMLSIGFFVGLSQAVSILVGTELGKQEYETGMFLSKKSIHIGIIGSIIIGLAMISIAWVYPNLYLIDESTKATTSALLIVFSIVLWIKVSNMILGGILKSGGKTHYTLFLDVTGTWAIGIPLGFISAFLLKIPIAWVYLIISIEELVKFIVGYQIMKSRKWIRTI